MLAFKGRSYGPAILTSSGGLLNLKQEMDAMWRQCATAHVFDFAHEFWVNMYWYS